MRGNLSFALDQSEQTYYSVPWDITFSAEDQYVCVTYNGHRAISTNPDVVAFLRGIDTTIRYAHWHSTDDIPTDADIACAILAGEGLPPGVDLLPDNS